MTNKKTNLKSLPWTGERYLPEVHGGIELEHLHRYLFAKQFLLGKRVLDIASGEGYGSALLAQSAISVVGVDISPEAVAHATMKYQADNLRFRLGSCAAIPLADHSVDVVVSFETIEHHQEHEAMMREFKRVLVPSGLLVISCPDKFEYSDRPNYANPYHVRELYRDEFKSLLDLYFKNQKMAGQRLIYGSAIFEEDGFSKVRSYDLSDKSLLSVPGISSAIYLVSIASDGELPISESGILEQSINECDVVMEIGTQIASLNQMLTERDEQVASLNQMLTERDEQVASLNQTITEILQSTSWTITKWFRYLGTIEKKIIQLLSIRRIGRYVFRKLHISMRVKSNNKDEAKKILIINDTTPTPDRDSGSLDVYFFMKVFIELGYNITFIPDDLEPKGHYTDNLRSLDVRCLTYEDIDSIEGFLREEGFSFDVVLLYRVHTARMHAANVRKYAPKAKVVFDTVDLHFLREERQAALDNSREAQASARFTKEAEFEMMRVADATIVLSSVEHDIVVEHDSSINVFTIPYMREIPGCKLVYAERRDIVFIGGFLHLPNVDSVSYFVNEIWPLVRTALPEVNFIILGSSPPDEILGLSDIDSRIQVVGFVEDIEPYFNNCRISIAPIRYGAGIKGKIGTSASYGVPCVASSLAVEGMGLIDGLDVLVADTAEMFAEKIIKLYSDETLWKQLSNNSLDFMQHNYSYQVGKKRLQRLLNSLDVGLLNYEILEFTEIESLTEYQSYKLRRREEYVHRGRQERASIGDARGFALEGYCAVCHKPTTFHTDYEYALHDADGNKQVNWRERMVCRSCELNNRVRAALHLFKQECAPPQNSDIYVTEQTTPLFTWVKNHYSSVFGSEFLGSDRLPAEINSAGIRHESLTGLSFADKAFDFILSFDVLEHIPDYQMAILECSRVLRPGGQMLFSVPFCFDSNEHIVRARINDDGSVDHLMEPEYHGDPVNVAGCLCFYHFGWRLLDEFREAGFDSVKAIFYWSDKFGYLGFDQALFIATKRDEMVHP